MSKSNKQKESTPINFESSMDELAQVVDSMEAGGLSLEKALEKFERGIQLVQQCQKKLKDAEQRVYQLVEKEGKASLIDAVLEEKD